MPARSGTLASKHTVRDVMNSKQKDNTNSNLQPLRLSDISWFDIKNLAGRTVPILPFYHQKTGWTSFIRDTRITSPPNSLVRLNPLDVVETPYFADSCASDDDGYSCFFDFIYQRAMFQHIHHQISAIFDDLLNLGASVQKIDILFSIWDERKLSPHLISSEIEYIYMACRSIFDHLQKVIKELWKTVRLSNPPAGKPCDLKDSFREMLFTKDAKTHYSRDQLIARYHLVPQLADYYLRNGHFFEYLRKCRVDFEHHGKSVDTIFYFPKSGFGISLTDPRFSQLDIWADHATKNGKAIGSLKWLCAYVIGHTVSALEDFAVTIQKYIGFPEPIAPNHKVLLRAESLKWMIGVIEGEPWLDTSVSQGGSE